MWKPRDYRSRSPDLHVILRQLTAEEHAKLFEFREYLLDELIPALQERRARKLSEWHGKHENNHS